MGRNRTMSICLTDLPKERIVKHQNGKMYLNLNTYDYDTKDKFGNDFSVSLPLTDLQKKDKEQNKPIERVFLGSGKIWADLEQTLTDKEKDDLPF